MLVYIGNYIVSKQMILNLIIIQQFTSGKQANQDGFVSYSIITKIEKGTLLYPVQHIY